MSESTRPLLDPAFLGRLEQLEIVSRKILRGRMKGDRLTRRKGQSVEFADFRNYVVGDDLRFLDWNLFARLDRLFLRLFLEEEDLHVYLLIDRSLSMDHGTPTKLQTARQVAASLGFIGLVNMDRILVHSFGDKLDPPLPALRGRRNLVRLLETLGQIAPGGGSDFTAAMKQFATRLRGRGVVIVLSDFLDKSGYAEGLRYLLARDLDLHVIQILAREEIDPPYLGDLKLTDREDADEAEVTISAPLLARYRATLDAFRHELQQFCTRRGIGYLFTGSDVPFEKLVLGYLQQRGLVR